MLYKYLLEETIIKNWLASTSRRPQTRRLYGYSMQYYTEFLKMTPEEILAEAEDEMDRRVKPRNSKLLVHLNEFRENLEKQGYAPLTIKSRMTAVYSFYTTNDIQLPKLPRNEMKAKPLKEHMAIPEKENLQAILRHCDELEKVVVLIGASAGLGAQEISNLKVCDFNNGYDEKTGVTTLQLRREKAQWDFVTYLSPEATQAVNDYLDYRKRTAKGNGERRNRQLAKQRVYSDSDYLLIRRKVPNEYLETHDEELRRLSEKAIGEIYIALAESANLSTPHGEWGLVRSHNVRKVFNSTLLNNGADSFRVDFWMGHTQDDTRAAYFRAAAKGGLRDTYMEYMSFLSLVEKYDPEKDPNFKKLKDENKVLSRVVENTAYESRTARNEVEDAKEEIEKLKQRLEDAENDYRAIQADKELEGKARAHDMEEMRKDLLAEMKAMLGGSQDKMKKSMKTEPVKADNVEDVWKD
jgi:integrase